jgi:multiple sugar transport system substrate-binding protein
MTPPGRAAGRPLDRRQLLGLLAGGAISAAAGCTRPNRRPATQEAPPAFDGEGRITFAAPTDFSLGEQRRRSVERWNEDNPSQRVDYVELPAAADHQRAELIARLQAGQAAYDVLGLDVVWTAEFAHGGYILPLDSVAGQLGLDHFLPSALETARFEGRLWGVPLYSNAALLYYRKDLVLGPPNSWAELAEQAAAAAQRHPVAGYVGQLRRYEGLTVNLAEAVWGQGGDLLRADGSLDAESTARGLAFLAGGLRDGWIPASALGYDEELSRLAFQGGGVAFMRNWPYAYDLLDAQDSPVKGRFDVARLPGVSALGGANLAVSRFSRRRRTALAFIRFLSKAEVQATVFEQGGYPAAVTDVYEDRAVQARQGYTAELKEGIVTARPRPSTPFYGQATRVLQQAAWSVLRDKEDPRRAADRLADAMAAALRGG